MKIDNIYFNKEAISKMSMNDFKSNFSGKFKKIDIKEAAKLLGIKQIRRKYKSKSSKK